MGDIMLFVFIITFIAVFGGITAGAIKKFELNNIVLSKKQKIVFPLIVINLLFLHFLGFISNIKRNKELSFQHLAFGTIKLPAAFACLIEIVILDNLEINSTNWFRQYKSIIDSFFGAINV
jgi:hypothetical protein